MEVKLLDFHRQTLDRSGLLFKSTVSRYLFLLKYLFLFSSVECFSYSPEVFFIISAVLLHAQAPLIKTFCKLNKYLPRECASTSVSMPPHVNQCEVSHSVRNNGIDKLSSSRFVHNIENYAFGLKLLS